MYFITTMQNAKKAYLCEADQSERRLGFELTFNQSFKGKPPTGALYWVTRSDAELEVNRLKEAAPSDEILLVEKQRWADVL